MKSSEVLIKIKNQSYQLQIEFKKLIMNKIVQNGGQLGLNYLIKFLKRALLGLDEQDLAEERQKSL